MQLDEDTEESEGAPSEGGGAHPGRARLIPTFRLLSKSVMAKCKGDLEENDTVLGCGVWMFPNDVLSNTMELIVVKKKAICATLNRY